MVQLVSDYIIYVGSKVCPYYFQSLEFCDGGEVMAVAEVAERWRWRCSRGGSDGRGVGSGEGGGGGGGGVTGVAVLAVVEVE